MCLLSDNVVLFNPTPKMKVIVIRSNKGWFWHADKRKVVLGIKDDFGPLDGWFWPAEHESGTRCVICGPYQDLCWQIM